MHKKTPASAGVFVHAQCASGLLARFALTPAQGRCCNARQRNAGKQQPQLAHRGRGAATASAPATVENCVHAPNAAGVNRRESTSPASSGNACANAPPANSVSVARNNDGRETAAIAAHLSTA